MEENNMKMTFKRLCALALVLCMVFSMLPVLASADNSFVIIDATGGYTGTELAGALFDGNSATKWGVSMPTSDNIFIVWKLPVNALVDGYTMTTGNDNSTYHGRNPKDWKLYAWTGSGVPARDSTDWTEIDSVTDDAVLTDENQKSFHYEISGNTIASNYYKLEISALKGAPFFQLSEFALHYSALDDDTLYWNVKFYRPDASLFDLKSVEQAAGATVVAPSYPGYDDADVTWTDGTNTYAPADVIPVTADLELKAVLTDPTLVSLMFLDTDGNPISVLTGEVGAAVDTASVPTVPAKEGHNAKWAPVVPAAFPAADMIFSPNYTAKNYNVYYKQDSATIAGPEATPYGEYYKTLTADAAGVVIPDGKEFLGWVDQWGNFMVGGKSYRLTTAGQTVLNPVFGSNTEYYLVNLIGADGMGCYASALVEKAAPDYELPAYAPYPAAQWEREADSTLFDAGDTATLEADTTFCAIAPAMHTVTYRNEDGTQVVAFSVRTGDAVPTSPVPAKEGYTGAWDNTAPAAMPDNDLSFTAVYTPKTYNVRYTYKASGSTTTYTTTVTFGGTFTPDAYVGDEPDGADFIGWTGSDGNFYAVGKTYRWRTPGGTTLTPVFDNDAHYWIVRLYHPADGGIAPYALYDVALIERESGDTMYLLPEYAPYPDAKWTYVGDGTPITTNYIEITENTDLVAIAPDMKTVTFKDEDGRLMAVDFYRAGKTITDAPDAPAKEGYIFDGWYDALGNELEVGTTTVADHVVYTPKYIPENYTLTYYRGVEADDSAFKCFLTLPDGAVVEFYNNDITDMPTYDIPDIPYGTKVVLGEASLPGYVFQYWLDKDGDIHLAGSNFEIKGDSYLTAIWEPDTELSCFVSFNTEDGVYTGFLTYDGQDAVIPAVDPVKDGKTFIGWKYDGDVYSNSGVKDFTVVADADRMMIFNAVWEDITYTVTLDDTMNPVDTIAPLYYGDEFVLPPAVDKDGFTFVAWMDQGNGAYYMENAKFYIDHSYDFVAVYSEDLVEYAVKFFNEDGNLIDLQLVPANSYVDAPYYTEGRDDCDYRWEDADNGRFAEEGDPILVDTSLNFHAVKTDEAEYPVYVTVQPFEAGTVYSLSNATYKLGDSVSMLIEVPDGYVLKAVEGTAEAADGTILPLVDSLDAVGSAGNYYFYVFTMPAADVYIDIVLEKIPAGKVILNYYVDGDLYDYEIVTKGESGAPAAEPVVAGKQFKQWNGDNGAILSAGESYTVAPDETASSINFFAEFIDNEYTVTYLSAPYAAATGLLYGEKYTVEDAFDRDGYEFVAWSGSDGAVYDAKESIVITEDLTLTPIWKEIVDTYAIKFYDEFNNLYEAYVITEGDSFDAPIYVPARAGMVYAWSDTVHSVALNAGDFYTPHSDMVFALHIEQEGKYPVNVTVLPTDAPANVAGPINPEYEYNTSVIVPINVPEGYVLKDVQSVIGTSVAVPGSLVTTGADTYDYLFTMPEGAVTVIVVLEKIPAGYTAVKFINDGELYDYVIVEKGTNGTAPAVAPSKPGYDFVEWRTESGFVGAGGFFAVPIDAPDEIVYNAIYEQLFYKVHFNLDGGLPDFADITGIAYNDTVTLAGEPAKDGYVFIGWREDATGIIYGANGNYVVTANADFTAIWEQAEYVVRFLNPENGTIVDYVPVNSGDQVTSPASASAAGKTFQYWQNEADPTDIVLGGALTPNIFADTVYAAVFENNVHSVLAVANNCTVNGLAATYAVGETVTFTVQPADGYAMESVVLTYTDGLAPVIRELKPVGVSYTFTMPDADVTVTATAVQNVFSIFKAPDANTLITCQNKAEVGETVYFEAAPNSADYVSDEVYVLTASGAPVALSIVDGKYAFTMPAEDVTVTAKSVKAEYTVTFLDDDNTLLGIVPVNSGEYVTAPVASKDGYTFKRWEILPLTDPAVDFDPLTDEVKGNLVVRAVYEGDPHTVEAGLIDNVEALSASCKVSSGSVNSSDLLQNKLLAETGKDVYFTVAAEYDYVITGVAIVGLDGSKTIIEPTLRLKETIDGINYYTVTFPMPAEDVKIDIYTVAKMFRVDVEENIPFAGDYTLNGFYTNNLMIPQGDYVAIEIAPIPGYEVVDVTGTFFDGISVTSLVDFYLSADKTYFGFPMVAKDVQVYITYAPIDYTIDIETSNFETYKPDASVNPAVVIESLDPDLTSQGRIELIPYTERDYTNALSQIYKIPANTTAIVNDRIYFKVVEYTGYDLDTLTVYFDGFEQTCPITKLADGSYCFDMPADDVAIVATFVEETYKVSKDAASEAHGQVEINGLIENSICADYKDEITVTVTPDDGYQVSKIYYVLEDGSVKDFDADSYENATVMADTLDGTHTIFFHMPATNVTVYAEYAAIDYTVSDIVMEADVTGYTTPSHVGDQVTFTTKAHYGYIIEKVYVINETTGERVYIHTDSTNTVYGADYYFTMPASAVTIYVNTVKDEYNVIYLDNGDFIGGEKIEYLDTANVADYISAVHDADPGYHFVGWTSAETQTPVTVPSIDNADFVIVKDTFIRAAYEKDEIDVLFVATVNGTVTELSTGNTAEYRLDTTVFGDKVEFTAVPDVGYVIDTISITTTDGDGYNLELAYKLGGGKYSFIIPATFKADVHAIQAEDVIVVVTFKKDTFTLTKAADCETEGEISVNGSVATETSFEYLYQDEVTVTATPKDGYYVASIVAVNADESEKFEITGTKPAVDTLAGAPLTLSFKMPASDLTYKVDYEKIDYSITCVYDAVQGKVETAPADLAQIDDIVTATVTPQPGYELQELTVTYDGGEKSCVLTEIAENVYTFTMPTYGVTVTALFTEITYKANLEVIGEATTALNGYDTTNVPADYLDTVTITITPDAGWELTSIVINEGTVTVNEAIKPEGGDYTFTMPHEDVNIVATLVKTGYDMNSYALNFYEMGHGTVTLNPEKVAYVGDKIIITADPDDGYRVKEVVVEDENGYAVPVSFISGTPGYIETWSFTMPAAAVDIYVMFEVQGASYYYDVRTDHWFYNSVTFVTDRGYFLGITDELFAPYMNMNRAMFVTVLGRITGVDTSAYTAIAFSDVEAGSYYAPYVAWAAENGIVVGRNDQIFDPYADITREEMAAIMYRYCKFLGEDMTLVNQVFMDRYADADQISDWAVEYVEWAVGVGLMRGMTPYTIDPLDYATRAQVAQVIMNLCDKVLYE